MGSSRQRPSVWTLPGSSIKAASKASSLASRNGVSPPPTAPISCESTRSAISCGRRGERFSVDQGVARFARLAMRREEILRGLVECLACAPQATRRKRQRLRREPERFERFGASPHPRALEARIDIARVGDKGDTCLVQRGDEPRLRHIEQGPEDGDSRPCASLRDRRQAIETAAALEPHQEGLGLVVEMVRGDERRNVVGMAIGRHEIVARGARSCLKACRCEVPVPPRSGSHGAGQARQRCARPSTPRRARTARSP